MATNQTITPENQAKTQQFRTAFLNAIDELGKAETTLSEFAVLNTIEKLCKNRKDDIKDDAITQAKEQLRLAQRTNGNFCYEGFTFSLSKKATFDFVGKPQKYWMPEGVDYRRKAAEKDSYGNLVKGLTKEMKAIMDAFPLKHPSIEPDITEHILKVVDNTRQ